MRDVLLATIAVALAYQMSFFMAVSLAILIVNVYAIVQWLFK